MAGDGQSEGCCPHCWVCWAPVVLLIPFPVSPCHQCMAPGPAAGVSPGGALHPSRPAWDAARIAGSSTAAAGQGSSGVSPGEAGMTMSPDPASPRSPAGGEAPVHLPWLRERTKEGICGRGSAAAGCAAVWLIRPAPSPGPRQCAAAVSPLPPCPRHSPLCPGLPQHRQHRAPRKEAAQPSTRGPVRSQGRGPGAAPPTAPRPRPAALMACTVRSRRARWCRGGIHPG